MPRALLLSTAFMTSLASFAAAAPLQVAGDASPTGLDPHVVTAFASVMINSNIYEGLTVLDKNLAVAPGVAESWTVSPDGLAYVFNLNPKATFHNGKAVTPADVIASLNRVKDTKTASPYAIRFGMVADASVTGANQVTFKLSAASAPLLSQLSVLAIMPAEPGDVQKVPIGTGPFKFKEWVPDTHILLERHEQYQDRASVKLDGIKWNIVPEAATRAVGLSGGTYQFLPGIDAATAQQLRGQPNVTILEASDLAYSLVGMNTSKAPFDKPAVREALNYALDRSQIVQAAYFGRAVPAGPLSPALTDFATPVGEFGCYKTDPEKAKALLKSAGIDGPLKVTFKVIGSLKQAVDASQVVQAQLNKAGFDVSLEIQEQGKFVQDWRNSNFDGFVSVNGGAPDPDDYFTRTFRTGGSTNVFKYTNPALDELLDKGRATADKAQRQGFYKQAQAILACQGPVAHLAFGTSFTAMRSNVSGYETMGNRATRYLKQTEVK